MARRGPPIEVEFTEGAIRVRRAGRTLTIPAGAPAPDDAEEADFLVRLDAIEHWDAPNEDASNEDLPIDIVELQKILEAVEEQAARHGLVVVFD